MLLEQQLCDLDMSLPFNHIQYNFNLDLSPANPCLLGYQTSENLLLRNTDQKFPCGWCWQAHNVKCYRVRLCLLCMEDYWPCKIGITAIYCSASFAQEGKNKNFILFVGGRCCLWRWSHCWSRSLRRFRADVRAYSTPQH